MDFEEEQDRWRYWAFGKSIKDYAKASYPKWSFRRSHPDIDWGVREERPKFDAAERKRREREREWRAYADKYTPLWAEAVRVAQTLSRRDDRRGNGLYGFLMLRAAELFKSGRFYPEGKGAKSYLRDHLNRRAKDWRRREWRIENRTQAFVAEPDADDVPAIDERIAELPAEIRVIAEHMLIGRTQKEIAAELGVDERTIRRRIERWKEQQDVSRATENAA